MNSQRHMIKDIRIDDLDSLIPLIEEINRFCGEWHKKALLEPAAVKSLKQMIIATSAAASTRIEGARLNDKQAFDVILKKKRLYEPRSAGEVLGYSEALRFIFRQRPARSLLSQKFIIALHQKVMRYSEESLSSRYRFSEVNVTDGHGGILLVCALPDLIPGFMKNTIKRLVTGWRNGTRSKLLLIAEFIAEFLAIHPFEDGNGRCARLLTVMLLKMAGHDYLQFTSLEQQIEKHKMQYYLTLNEAQKTGLLDRWLKFCLNTIRAAQLSLERRLKMRTPGRQKGSTPLKHEIIDIFKVKTTCRAGEIVKLTGKSPAGIRKILNQLVRSKVIKAYGKNRGRYYTKR